jgi:hypothetical protein
MARKHPRTRHRIDGRTRVARRAQALAQAYVTALDSPTDALVLEAVNRAAQLTAQAEDARVRYAGGDLGLEALVSLENLARRARLEVQRATGRRSRPGSISPPPEPAAPAVDPSDATGPSAGDLEGALLEITDEPMQAAGETRQAYLRRIFDAYQELPDAKAAKLCGESAEAWYDIAAKAAESGAVLPEFTGFAVRDQIPGDLPHTPPKPVTDALEAELLAFLALDPQRDGEGRSAYLARRFDAAQAARITPRWDRAPELVATWFRLAIATQQASQPCPSSRSRAASVR